jgi:hypothetical protein
MLPRMSYHFYKDARVHVFCRHEVSVLLLSATYHQTYSAYGGPSQPLTTRLIQVWAACWPEFTALHSSYNYILLQINLKFPSSTFPSILTLTYSGFAWGGLGSRCGLTRIKILKVISKPLMRFIPYRSGTVHSPKWKKVCWFSICMLRSACTKTAQNIN